MRIAIFLSHDGTNLQAVIDAVRNKWLDVTIAGVISDNAQALGLKRAEKAHIQTAAIEHTSLASFEEQALEKLELWQVDCLVLSHFNLVLSAEFIENFHGVMINLHPSLHKQRIGLNTHKAVLQKQESMHGCRVHFVTEKPNAGMDIAKNMLTVCEADTVETLKEKVAQLEQALLPRVINWIAEHRFYIADNTLFLDGFPLKKPLTFFELVD